MKKGLLIFLAFILVHSTNAQWKIIDTVGSFANGGIHFWNINEGIACIRQQGTIMKTKNGGQTWDTVLLVNDSIKTLEPPQSVWLEDMQFISDDIGFATGGSMFSPVPNMLFLTYNRGNTWKTMHINTLDIYGIVGGSFLAFDTEIQGVLYNSNAIMKTTDSGKTFAKVPIPTGVYIVSRVIMTAPNTVAMVGYAGNSVIYITTDWGVKWQKVYEDTAGIGDIYFRNGKGIAANNNGAVLRSDNNGYSWIKLNIQDADSMIFDKVKIERNNDLYLLGNNKLQGYVYGSSDNGVTWKRSKVDYDYHGIFRDISMPTRDTGYIASTGRLYRTNTGGGLSLAIKNKQVVENSIMVYPNPTKNEIHVDAGNNIVKSISIIDMAGKKIETTTKYDTIDVSTIPSGTYIMEIQTSDNAQYKKFILNR